MISDSQSLNHHMDICRVMHVYSPVEKRHHTKTSYRKATVFKVVCGDISKSKLVLGTLIQRLQNYNFRLRLQSLSHHTEICRAMNVQSPVEKRHHTKNPYMKSTVSKVVCGTECSNNRISSKTPNSSSVTSCRKESRVIIKII